MLTYNDLVKKSLTKVLKNKKVIINTLLVFLPVFIGIIVNTVILYDFNREISLLVEEYSLMIYDTMTNGEYIIKDYIDKFLLIVSQNGVVITTSIIINIGTYVLAEIFECVIYYAVYGAVEKKEITIKESYKIFIKTFPLFLYKNLLIFLWSLLFIIPGIYKFFEYSLCYSIKIENPSMKSKECINKSKEMMKGRKERMFLQTLYIFLFMIIINFLISTIFSVLSIIPYVSLIADSMTNSISTAINEILIFSVIAIFYNEIKFDEKVLQENPELKEKGVSVIIRPDPDRKVRVFYTSINPYGNNYNRFNNNYNNPNQSESFSRKDIYSQPKVKEDPFEKAERETKEEDNK